MRKGAEEEATAPKRGWPLPRSLPSLPSERTNSRPGIRACSSIAGRRASEFLQVPLSKVPRHQHGTTFGQGFAEALPINAHLTTSLGIPAVRFRRGSPFFDPAQLTSYGPSTVEGAKS